MSSLLAFHPDDFKRQSAIHTLGFRSHLFDPDSECVIVHDAAAVTSAGAGAVIMRAGTRRLKSRVIRARWATSDSLRLRAGRRLLKSTFFVAGRPCVLGLDVRGNVHHASPPLWRERGSAPTERRVCGIR
jgi:hypothetical protein